MNSDELSVHYWSGHPHYLFSYLSKSGLIQCVQNNVGTPPCKCLCLRASSSLVCTLSQLVIASVMDCRLHPFIGIAAFTIYVLPLLHMGTHAATSCYKWATCSLSTCVFCIREHANLMLRQHTHTLMRNMLSSVHCVLCHCVTGIDVAVAEWILSWVAYSAGGGGGSGDRTVSVKQARGRDRTSPIRANSKWIRILSDSCLIRFECMWKGNICFCRDVCWDSLCTDAQSLRSSLLPSHV